MSVETDFQYRLRKLPGGMNLGGLYSFNQDFTKLGGRLIFQPGQELSVEKEDDTWAYIPSLRRVRRVATTQKSDSLLGTEFTLEDFYMFSGYVLDQQWEFRGESKKLGSSSWSPGSPVPVTTGESVAPMFQFGGCTPSNHCTKKSFRLRAAYWPPAP